MWTGKHYLRELKYVGLTYFIKLEQHYYFFSCSFEKLLEFTETARFKKIKQISTKNLHENWPVKLKY